MVSGVPKLHFTRKQQVWYSPLASGMASIRAGLCLNKSRVGLVNNRPFQVKAIVQDNDIHLKSYLDLSQSTIGP